MTFCQLKFKICVIIHRFTQNLIYKCSVSCKLLSTIFISLIHTNKIEINKKCVKFPIKLIENFICLHQVDATELYID